MAKVLKRNQMQERQFLLKTYSGSCVNNTPKHTVTPCSWDCDDFY